MSAQQKAISSLTLLVEGCNAALQGFSENVNVEDYPTSDFSVLRTDFISILAIIYAATTKVALSLKPSDAHHQASLVPLKDLANNVAALVHSIRLMRLQEGATVLAEYETTARNVICAIKSLAENLLQNYPPQSYLVRTGEIHELIDHARRSGGLSMNNLDAVKKLWLQKHDSLMDGYEEIQEICRQSEAEGEDEDEEAFDDGWKELGINSKQKLSSSELDRATKVQSLIKMTTLLHKRIIKDILSVQRANSTLDKLSPLSDELLNTSDDLISSMYAPQEISNIKPSLDAFWDVTKKLHSTIFPSKDQSLEEKLSNMSLSSDDKSHKWFVICFDQIDKAVIKISEGLLETTSS